jgi:hypothetical protein
MRPEGIRVARAVRIAEILSGLGLAAVLALPRLVPLERIRARALAEAENTLHRPVEAGDVRLEVFTGLGAGVENFAVRNGPGWESPALFSAERVSLKLAFWPLLARRVEVERIVVDEPTVALERNERGQTNVDDLAARARDVSRAAATGPSLAVPAALVPESFLVSRIEVRRGRVVFLDRLAAAGRARRVAVEDVDASVRDIGSKAATRFDVTARFLSDAARNVSIRGSIVPPKRGTLANAPMRVSLSAKELDLARITPLRLAVPAAPFAAAARDGTFSVDATAEGAVLGALTMAGKASLVPRGATRLPPIDGEWAMTLDWPSESLVVRRASLRAGSVPITAEGRIDGIRGAAPRVDARVATPGSVDLGNLLSLAAAAGRSTPANLRLSGRLRFEARVRGASSDLAARVQADASSLDARVDGQPVFAAAALHASAASRGVSAAQGRIAAPSGAVRGIPFEDLTSDWRWNDGTLVVTPLLRVFGGRVGMRMEASLGRPDSVSRFTVELAGLPADRLTETAPAPLRGLIGGTVGGWLTMSGRGLGTEAFARTAEGEGRISVSRAELRTVRLMPEIVRTVARAGRVAGFDVPDGLDAPRRFELSSGFRFGGGRVATPDLTLESGDVVIRAGGSVAPDRTLAYRGRVVLGREAVASLGRMGAYLADSSGRFEIPFCVSGRADAPRVSVELDAFDIGRRLVRTRVRGFLPDRARRILDGALEGLDGTGFRPLERLRGLLSESRR